MTAKLTLQEKDLLSTMVFKFKNDVDFKEFATKKGVDLKGLEDKLSK